MTIEQAAVRAISYIKNGMDHDLAISKACAEARSAGLGDFAEGWDTFTTYAPWVAAAIGAYLLYRGAVKVKRATGEYVDRKRRQARAARAAWDAAA
jgi:hypothetical protein